MGLDSNRGRDLPRSKQKIVKLASDPKSEEGEKIVALAAKRERNKKKLSKIITEHGFDALLPSARAMSDKAKSRKRSL